MIIKTFAAAALAVLLALGASTAALAAVTHQATLTGNVVQVTLDAEVHNAGQQASVLIMRVGAKYSAPATADIVFTNEYTVDLDGSLVFSAALPAGNLDDYVLAVNVAGATQRYLASLNPLGPVPVEPQQPDGGNTNPPTDGAENPDGIGGEGSLAATGANIAVGLSVLVALSLLAAGVVVVSRSRARRALG